jgi:hypothetical protein
MLPLTRTFYVICDNNEHLRVKLIFERLYILDQLIEQTILFVNMSTSDQVLL